MTACRGLTSACNGLDLRPMRFALTSRVLVMCEGCRGTSIAQSAHLIERRQTAREAQKQTTLRSFLPLAGRLNTEPLSRTG